MSLALLYIAFSIAVPGIVFYRTIRRIHDVTWKHHGWYGLTAMAIALLGMVFLPSRWWLLLLALGLWNYLDDLRQHLIQFDHPEFRSKINRLYGRTLYRWFPRLG